MLRTATATRITPSLDRAVALDGTQSGSRPRRLELHVYTALVQTRVEVSGELSHG